VVRVSDLRLNGHKFEIRPPHYQSVGIGMGDNPQAGVPPRYVISHQGQLSLLPSVVREMSTGQRAVMHCGWGSKAGWLMAFVDKRVGDRKNVPRQSCWT